MLVDSPRIIVADDDRVVRRIVKVKLSGLGYSVSEAEDGQQALDLIRSDGVPDLLIVDGLMPGVDGLQVVRTLRASPDQAEAALPIVMLTSRQSEHDIIEGLQAGLDDYIIKPFSPDELAARVRTVLWRATREQRH